MRQMKMVTLLSRDWYDEDEKIHMLVHFKDKSIRAFHDVVTDVSAFEDVTAFEYNQYGRRMMVSIDTSTVQYVEHYPEKKETDESVASGEDS